MAHCPYYLAFSRTDKNVSSSSSFNFMMPTLFSILYDNSLHDDITAHQPYGHQVISSQKPNFLFYITFPVIRRILFQILQSVPPESNTFFFSIGVIAILKYELVGWLGFCPQGPRKGIFVSSKAHVPLPTRLSNQGDPLVVRPKSRTQATWT